MDHYEFDKIFLAIALAFFAFVLCINLGNFVYYPEIPIEERGYKIEIPETTSTSSEKSTEIDESNIDIKTLFIKANYKNGESIFKKCSICHTINKGDANKIGPNLWNIVNSKVASKGDFAYSSAMKNRGESDYIWSFQELIQYLKSPKKHIPGTKMAFAGIKNLEDRIDLIEFLRNNADIPYNVK